ncbi:MAG: ABC transporter permease [Proteobacteria bacterium]|nr:ABC transporter permease [Pseudomonadota bacterium]
MFETASGDTGFSPRRVGALILRYLYVLRSSWPRLLELAYWPAMQVIVWGFITQFFMTNSSWVAQATGVLLGAVLLWDVLFRSQLGISVSFLEEMWSRNLGHLFVSPLRPYEFLIALATMSLVRTLIGMLPAALLAIPLYHYSIFDLGLPLLILCFGLGAEGFAWVAVFAISPIAAVFYPVSVLPAWLQGVAYALPPAHVFEGMRTLMVEHVFPTDHLLAAIGLNALYLAVAGAVFLAAFARARVLGKLLQVGE